MSEKYILFIQTAFIGDLFLSLPTLDKIRNLYPQHKIILICKKGLSEFFLKEKKVDLCFEVEKNNSNSYKKILTEIHDLQIEAVFCPHRSLRSALLARKINSKIKVGFKSWFSFFIFNKTVTYFKKWPDVIRQMNILTAVDEKLFNEINKKDWAYLNFKKSDGSFEIIPEIFEFSINSTNSLLRTTKNNLQNNLKNNTVALFPGSVWKTKQWSIDGFSQVAHDLLKNNYSVILLGGPIETTICQKIKSDNPEVIDYSGKLSLYDSYLKLKECKFVVCNDSAPAHMAASLGVKVISIFGPTTLSLGFRPWNNESKVVENLNLDCRPCGAHGHHICPKGHHKCMKEISAKEVIAVIE